MNIAVGALRYVLLIVFSLFFIFPYFYMLTRSLMSLSEVNAKNFLLFPSELHFENYKVIIDYLPAFAEYVGRHYHERFFYSSYRRNDRISLCPL